MRVAALSLLIAFWAASCQPDMSDELPRRQVYASLQDFQAKNKVAPQTFTANSSNTIAIQGAKGSRFVFPANAFVTQSGQPVTGDVAIEVKEILKPIDMILSGMPTMSDGKPLESGGQFFIRATKNNEELKLAPGRQVQVKVNVDTPMVNMQVFTGQVTPAGTVNWQLSTNQTNVIQRDTFGTAFAIGYTMFSNQINWLNIDKFIPESLIRYTVHFGNCPDPDQTAIYIHLTGRNAVLGMPKLTDAFHSEQLVAGAATIVAISIKDKKLYYAFAPVTLTQGGSTTLQFMETTEEQLKAKLATLH